MAVLHSFGTRFVTPFPLSGLARSLKTCSSVFPWACLCPLHFIFAMRHFIPIMLLRWRPFAVGAARKWLIYDRWRTKVPVDVHPGFMSGLSESSACGMASRSGKCGQNTKTSIGRQWTYPTHSSIGKYLSNGAYRPTCISLALCFILTPC